MKPDGWRGFIEQRDPSAEPYRSGQLAVPLVPSNWVSSGGFRPSLQLKGSVQSFKIDCGRRPIGFGVPTALLTGYASPDRIRRVGQTRLADWLQTRNVRRFADVAARAIAAAKAQSVVLPGQDLTASIISELARGILVSTSD